MDQIDVTSEVAGLSKVLGGESFASLQYSIGKSAVNSALFTFNIDSERTSKRIQV